MCGVHVPVIHLTIFSYSLICCVVGLKCMHAYVSFDIINVLMKNAAVCGGSLKCLSA